MSETESPVPPEALSLSERLQRMRSETSLELLGKKFGAVTELDSAVKQFDGLLERIDRIRTTYGKSPASESCVEMAERVLESLAKLQERVNHGEDISKEECDEWRQQVAKLQGSLVG